MIADIGIFKVVDVLRKPRVGAVQHGKGAVEVSGCHLVCKAFVVEVPGAENQTLSIMADGGILIYSRAVLIDASDRRDVGEHAIIPDASIY